MQQIDFVYEGSAVSLYTHEAPDHLYNVIAGSQTFYEIDLLEKARQIYRTGSLVIDVGANVGNHTIYFGKVMNADVLAFEPFEKSRDILKWNIRANACSEHVTLEACAIGSSDGRGSIRPCRASNYGMVSVEIATEGVIGIKTLDQFITPERSVGLVKIDIEGDELAALKGATRTLTEHKPHLFVEAATDNALHDLNEFLLSLDYKMIGRYCGTPTYLFSAAD